MQDDDFEWDDEKAAVNVAKHGVDFREATEAFKDFNAIEIPDDRFDYGEDRWIMKGMVGGKLVVVVYVDRNNRKRLISARRGERHDYDHYYSQT